MAEQTTESLAADIRPLAEEVLAFSPHYLVDVHVRGHRGTRVAEVYVDTDEEDMGLGNLAEVSRELGFLLDVEDVIKGKYTLEVSSPGAKRPLQHPRQYEKHVGRPLRVRFHADGDAEKVEGELVATDDEGIAVEAGDGDVQRIRYDNIEEAKIVLPW